MSWQMLDRMWKAEAEKPMYERALMHAKAATKAAHAAHSSGELRPSEIAQRHAEAAEAWTHVEGHPEAKRIVRAHTILASRKVQEELHRSLTKSRAVMKWLDSFLDSVDIGIQKSRSNTMADRVDFGDIFKSDAVCSECGSHLSKAKGTVAEDNKASPKHQGAGEIGKFQDPPMSRAKSGPEVGRSGQHKKNETEDGSDGSKSVENDFRKGFAVADTTKGFVEYVNADGSVTPDIRGFHGF